MTALEPPLGPDVRLALVLTINDTPSEIASGMREGEAS
jgi:hypothetical protein